MARKAGTHVYGPYARGTRWRVVVKSGSRQRPRSFESREAAEKYIREARLQIEGRTVSQALEDYIGYLASKGRAKSTQSAIRIAINRLVPDGPVSTIGPGRARTLYTALAASGLAAATHRNSLAATVAMWDWMVRETWASSNPWEDVEPLGQPKVGKRQLTLDEARRFVAVAYAEAGRMPGPVAVLLALMLGMRAGEIVGLTGRDVDDGGRLIRIQRGKTRRAQRVLEVPDQLRPHVSALAAKAGPDGRLFPFTRHNVGVWTRVLCERAGVSRVCPHGLRGTHTTLAVEAGATANLVAAALGHASTSVTRTHYIAPGAEDRATVDKMLAALGNGNGNGRFPGEAGDAN